MSAFGPLGGGGNGGNGAGITDAQRLKALEMARNEMEYRVDLFNRLAQTCFEKCSEKRYKEADLNVGETSCVDRCSSKYWQVVGMVGQMLGAAGANGNVQQ
ncbi:mitochondrial import inner membrane translocase subunit TIM10 [Pycnococcus provasolii]